MDWKQRSFWSVVVDCSRRASLTASLFYSLSSNLGNFGQKSHLTDSLTYLPIIQILNSGYFVTHFHGAIFSSQSLSSLSRARWEKMFPCSFSRPTREQPSSSPSQASAALEGMEELAERGIEGDQQPTDGSNRLIGVSEEKSRERWGDRHLALCARRAG